LPRYWLPHPRPPHQIPGSIPADDRPGASPCSGKDDAVILDHAGAVFSTGCPTIRLNGRSRRIAARRTRRIPPAAIPETIADDVPRMLGDQVRGQPCPACGWRPRPKPAAVEVAAGELAAVDRRRQTSAITYGIDERQKFYSQLLWIAGERGYQRGWAGHQIQGEVRRLAVLAFRRPCAAR